MKPMKPDWSDPRNAWWRDYGVFPRWVLGWRRADDLLCLDHPRSIRFDVPVLTADNKGETGRCAVCRHPLRQADAFPAITEADLGPQH